jgi:hypothetical protein
MERGIMGKPPQPGQSATAKIVGIRTWQALLLAGLLASSFLGCAAEEKKPRTVNEWLQQPRVGDPL